jgi:hypothetical protein
MKLKTAGIGPTGAKIVFMRPSVLPAGGMLTFLITLYARQE